ncbi:MAG: AIR synthase related protein, partial [Firmicutes bacterium]|nr:AIR synthase related protein [Bacillota bacterium]
MKFRDLTLIKVGIGQTMVIACDSLGAIGAKKADQLQTSGEIVGRLTVRVPLMEVVAAGAQPLAVVNTLCVEMEPTGRAIIAGIQQELAAAGFADLPITGSTEENMLTVQTGVGVTVIGLVATSALRLGEATKGSTVFCVGKPKVGEEVLAGESVADVPLVRALLMLADVQEVLPVGSKGILYEANQLAKSANLTFIANEVNDLELTKSAGPGTCVLVAASAGCANEVCKICRLPVVSIGELV